ncbi:MAG: glucoamylase family protein [Bryobacteraceae bacterium]
MQRRTAIFLLFGARFASRLVASALKPDDDGFLEDLSRRAFLYFWEQADPQTGLILDRARCTGQRVSGAAANVASIAATGFGLTALAIAAERGWIDEASAIARAKKTLRFFEQASNERGWFYHFLDATTGERRWECEVSSIDTALLLAGILTVRERFEDPEISSLATAIYNRVDFSWMLDGDSNLLSQGWKPESGFLKYRWDRFSELPLLYVLAIGSAKHPITAKAWYAWQRPTVTYAGFTYVNGPPPLFAQQYPQAWIDMRAMRDAAPSGIDYFQNSIAATRAHRAFCLDLAAEFPRSYSENVWGITASDSARGYVDWGANRARGAIDGTVVPCAAGGSLMFAPDICLPALKTMRERFGDRAFGRYGFCDAFNPTTGWVDSDVLGIDQGITLLSAENLRSGNVWRWFMRNPEVPRALELCKFRRDYDDKADLARREMMRKFLGRKRI